MSIELLTTTAETYVDSKQKKLSDYDSVGVSANGFTMSEVENELRTNASKKGCEVVTDVKYCTCFHGGAGVNNIHYTIYGTGLVPKQL